jgi:hypothetical protein
MVLAGRRNPPTSRTIPPGSQGDLDRRVTAADGRPVPFRQAVSGPDDRNGGWWFQVRRSPGADGVELVTAIPAYADDVTRHATQEDADAAAVAAYSTYLADVESAVSGAHSATQEAS